jgi:hypothetical protein
VLARGRGRNSPIEPIDTASPSRASSCSRTHACPGAAGRGGRTKRFSCSTTLYHAQRMEGELAAHLRAPPARASAMCRWPQPRAAPARHRATAYEFLFAHLRRASATRGHVGLRIQAGRRHRPPGADRG